MSEEMSNLIFIFFIFIFPPLVVYSAIADTIREQQGKFEKGSRSWLVFSVCSASILFISLFGGYPLYIYCMCELLSPYIDCINAWS